MSEIFNQLISCKVPRGNNIDIITGYNLYKNYWIDAEQETREWFNANIKDDWIMIDAGANIGVYTIQFAKKCKFVYSIEASTCTTNLLQRNIDYNSIKNVEIINKALGHKSGKFIDKVYTVWPNVIEEKEFEFVSLDDFIKESKIKLDCIKIDVDSYEFEVIKGFEETLKTDKPICIIETNIALHLRGKKESDLIDLMTSYNYKIDKILDRENLLFVSNN